MTRAAQLADAKVCLRDAKRKLVERQEAAKANPSDYADRQVRRTEVAIEYWRELIRKMKAGEWSKI